MGDLPPSLSSARYLLVVTLGKLYHLSVSSFVQWQARALLLPGIANVRVGSNEDSFWKGSAWNLEALSGQIAGCGLDPKGKTSKMPLR